MSNVSINGGNRRTLAVELLGAALALDLDATVVRTTSKGFIVPAEVAEAAGYGTDEPKAEDVVADEPVAEEPVADEPVAEEPVADDTQIEEPPLKGKGSGIDAWRAFAEAKGASAEDINDLSRDELAAAFGSKDKE